MLLAGLLYLMPALVAEKVLVSVYVLGFAGSFRWFLGAFGPRCRALSAAGLLLVYNRCLWLGFYNYCLSLILIWIVLGCCVRWRGQLHIPQMVALMLLFTAAYFTHLAGFLLAFAGALGATVLVPPRRILAPILVGLAALPPACLAMGYFEETGFFRAPSAQHLVERPLARLRGERTETSVWQELGAIDDELFAHHVGPALPGSVVFAGYFALLAVFTVAGYRRSLLEESAGPGRLFPAVFGLLLFGAWLLVPYHLLDFAHGGFLKTRLAPLPPLVWLACMREPAPGRARLLVRTATLVLLAANLVLVTRTIDAGNRELEQYTAGLDLVGSGHRLFVVQPNPSPTPLVNPLLHAADYYCLETANVNLDNYEATVPHFPVKYRAGMSRGRGSWANYPRKDAVDLVLFWQASGRGPSGWDEILSEGRLRIYRRPRSRDGEEFRSLRDFGILTLLRRQKFARRGDRFVRLGGTAVREAVVAQTFFALAASCMRCARGVALRRLTEARRRLRCAPGQRSGFGSLTGKA